MEEIEVFPVIVTCHTSGCGNADIPLELMLHDKDMRVICGVCSTDIKDKKIA